MIRSLFRLTLTLALVALASTSAFAHPSTEARDGLSEAEGQGGAATSSLTGVVVDSGGGVVPGATVVVKNNATGGTFNTVTNSSGAFSVPALDIGTYTVTISLQGFKTAVFNDVRLVAATPYNIRATLEVGSLTDTITVTGGSKLIQTESATVSSTISLEQITALPLVTRNALHFVVFLPGVETTGNIRDSTIMGLPQSTINITIDGTNVQDNFNKTSDGFFAIIRPQLDAVEEVTVTGATPGANSAGQGAVQIQFVTRSGTNQFNTSAYHYFRHPSLNSNYFFNKVNGLDRNEVILHQYGGRVGGPIVVPGLIDGRGKAFFFVNHEEFFQPTEATRTRTVLNPLTERGIYQYNVTTGGVTETRRVDLYALAAANGHVATPDPTIATLLANIRAATGTTGNLTQNTNNVNTMSYIYQAASTRKEHLPTTRLDFNLSQQHRLSATYYYQRVVADPDILNSREERFPGLGTGGTQTSHRNSGTTALRSTFSSNLVNELRFGFQWAPVHFSTNLTLDDFAPQGGFSIGFPDGNNTNNLSVTGYTGTNGPSARNASNWNVDDTMNWQFGNHAFNFGASFTQVTSWDTTFTAARTLGFNVDTTNDPAAAMFSSTNFQGASNNNITDARVLYGFLTGRITSIGATSRLDEKTGRYVYNGPRTQRGRLREFGAYAQDSWRLRPNLTVNAGLRWELQLPFSSLNDVMSMATYASLCGVSGVGPGPFGRNCNLFQPGTLTGSRPEFVRYDAGNPGYNTDWTNFAPNIGVAWRPNVQDGFLRTILGDPDQATIRGGFSIAYNRNGMGELIGIYSGNPGATVSSTRNVNNGNLIPAGQSWPLLLRSSANLLGAPPDCPEGTVAAGCIPAGPTYPIIATTNNNLTIFDPNITLSYSRSWTLGLQRSLSKDMAVEVRYVGTRNVRGWTEEDWNELNIFENGFLDEFKLAQANLRAHVLAGCGQTGNPACTFAYRGPGTGTSPLPIYLAYFSGLAAGLAGDFSRYTSTNFTNSAWTGHLGAYEPDPFDAANDLHGNATRRSNAIAAGLAPNFFVLNPDVDEANVTRSASGSRFHSFQLDLRRRMSQGLTMNFNYQYAWRWGTTFDTLRRDRIMVRSSGVPHALKMTWNYEVPVGRGKRFGSDMNGWLDTIVGGWEVNGTGRVQNRTLGLTGVRLVGMTAKDLEKAWGWRITKDATTGAVRVFTLPDDIILNTRRAYDTSSTALNGYGSLGPPEGRYIAPASSPDCIRLYAGDCGVPRNTYITADWFTRFDVSFKKSFRFTRKARFDLEVNFLNAFDNINFNYELETGSGDINRITSAYTDINNSFDPGGRLGQVVWRITW